LGHLNPSSVVLGGKGAKEFIGHKDRRWRAFAQVRRIEASLHFISDVKRRNEVVNTPWRIVVSERGVGLVK
jgi:hypothetical protein